MSEAGLSVREDAIGNIFGRWEGTDPTLPAVGSGSHTDAIPYAGKYDGVLGVLGAIHAVQALQRVKFQPKRSIDVIMFTSEEPTRFGFGCLGSRAMAKSGKIFDILREAKDSNNVTFADAAKEAGYTDVEEKLKSSGLEKGAYSAFVELHIEQGPMLEKEGKSMDFRYRQLLMMLLRYLSTNSQENCSFKTDCVFLCIQGFLLVW